MSDEAGEFGLIARHFRPLAGPGALDLLDDAAVFAPPPGRELVLAADAMVAGVHFLPDDPPETIGRKLLRVNLSDLAAMAATPLGYLMTISAPTGTGEPWFAAFGAGLAIDQALFDIQLLGGDTTSTPGPLTLSLTVLGHVAPGAALRRTGARPGDEVWVTGTIGDGALGLRALRGELPDPTGALADRYRLPRPRLGLRLHGIAAAGMDVSDGLIQDLGHMCRIADCGATIFADEVPRSAAARSAGPAWLETCLTGGDDYELVLAVRPERAAALLTEATRSGVIMTRIGVFIEGKGVDVASDVPMRIDRPGWKHF